MPQMQLPIFPAGSTRISSSVAFERRDGNVTYFNGQMPVFQHDINDIQSFKMIISQLYVNGNATQAEIARAFGVTPLMIKRSVKLYREEGLAGFYRARKTRGAAVLTPAIILEVQRLLDAELKVSEVGERLGLKTNTLSKAIRAGRLSLPKKKV